MRTVKSRQSQPTMYMYNECTKDPSLYRLVHVPHCIGQLALLTVTLIVWRMLVGKGKAYMFNAQTGRYQYRLWSYKWSFICPCWNMCILCSQYISTLCTLWSLWWRQCFFTIWQQMSLVFLIDSLECSLSSLQLPSDHYKRWRIPPRITFVFIDKWSLSDFEFFGVIP
jgi:hypothetical protein